MPELPEVECVRRTLERAIVGRRVLAESLRRPDICDGLARPGGASPLLRGAVVLAVLRHGKQLVIQGDAGRCLGVHLGMTGRLLVLPPAGDAPEPRTHVHACWRLDDGTRLLFHDPRRFGRLTLPPPRAPGPAWFWRALGPDALTITPADLRARLAGSRRAVKAALLDQHVLAGVGNIYADEALFAARLRPTRRCKTLRPAEVARLARALRRVLADAVRAGGSTVRTYASSDGSRGTYQRRHRVYGRGGLPCVRCGSPLRRIHLAQRSTVFCPACQR